MIRSTVIGIAMISYMVVFKLQAQSGMEMTQAAVVGHDKLDWSIAGNLSGANPNILSELSWQDLLSVGYQVGIKIPLSDRVYSDLQFLQRFTVKGQVTDTDYGSDNRTNTVFRASEDAGKGQTVSARVGFGIHLFQFEHVVLDMGGGYGWYRQGAYLVNDQTNLNSSYTHRWHGPLLNGSATVDMLDHRLEIRLQSTYHQIWFGATGNWNLIEDFQHPVSFRHRAKGLGWVNELTLRYRMSDHWHLFISSSYDFWTTGKGIDRLYRSDGTEVITQLNHVTRKSTTIGGGVSFVLFHKK